MQHDDTTVGGPGFDPNGTPNDGLQSPSVPAKKRLNPLVDLIETERAYVDLLASIIRRIASAWSRANFPPPELDAMFRAVESVYRANRGLLSKLKEIGPNPASPKALGDLLMRWIDDLEQPYSRYCDTYCTGFDSWVPVQSNPNLPGLLADVSAVSPPSSYTPGSAPEHDTWSLDTLFLIPATRIKYYKKLYTRLLKSTQPGRSDHRLLSDAVERLARLLEIISARATVQVGSDPNQDDSGTHEQSPATVLPSPSPSPAPINGGYQPPPRSTSAQTMPLPPISPIAPLNIGGQRHHDWPPSPMDPSTQDLRPQVPSKSVHLDDDQHQRDSQQSSATSRSGGSGSAGDRESRESAPTSMSNGVGPGSPFPSKESDEEEIIRKADARSTLTAPIVDLERRLSTERVLDIFTMQPKKCRLQMAPPNLPFSRSVRASTDATIYFTPRATGSEVVIQEAHIFLLTDLFLVCERMTEEEKRQEKEATGMTGMEMWLSYPPLSAKHLYAGDFNDGQSDNIFQVHVMKKEVLTIHVPSRGTKESLLRHFREAYEDAMNLVPPPRKPSLPEQTPHAPPSLPPVPSHAPLQTAPSLRAQTQSPPTIAHHPPLDELAPPRPDGFRPPRTGSVPEFGHDAPHPTARGGPAAHDAPGQFDPEPPRAQFGRLAAGSDPHLPSMGMGGQTSAPRLTGGPSPSNSEPGRGGAPLFIPPPRGASRSDAGRSPLRGDFGPMPPPPPKDNLPSLPSTPASLRQMNHSPSNASLRGPPPPPRDDSQGQPQYLNAGGPNNGMYGQPPLSARSFGSSASRQPSVASSSISRPSQLQTSGLSSRPHSPPLSESPPTSPEEDRKPTGPVTSTITAEMKCKVFLKQQHAQWKSLGSGKLLLYEQQPTNVKQLVVQADSKAKTLLISTIVLMDAVERVGKTGVAIEVSDQGNRTGVVYMIQLKSESSASGFFTTILAGSDRAK